METIRTAVRTVLAYEMTITEWLGIAVVLALPYLAVGLGWALTHPVGGTGGAVVTMLSWPALLITDACRP